MGSPHIFNFQDPQHTHQQLKATGFRDIVISLGATYGLYVSHVHFIDTHADSSAELAVYSIFHARRTMAYVQYVNEATNITFRRVLTSVDW